MLILMTLSLSHSDCTLCSGADAAAALLVIFISSSAATLENIIQAYTKKSSIKKIQDITLFYIISVFFSHVNDR